MRLPNLSASVARKPSAQGSYFFQPERGIVPSGGGSGGGGCGDCPSGTSRCAGSLDICGTCCRPGECEIFDGHGSCRRR